MAHENILQANGADDSFILRIRNIAETLVNLNYLTRVDADDSTLVRTYAIQTEERLGALGDLLRQEFT